MIENELNRFLMLASCYGLQMAPTPPAAYTHIPLSLIPTRFPTTNFRDLIDKTPLHNFLMFKVSRNTQYMIKCLEEVCKIDDFTRKLVEISVKAHSSRFYQNIFLGLTRNDFMFDENSEKFLQVEYNTIAASFVSLGTKIVGFHQHILSNYSSLFEDCPSSVLENNALENFVKGMKLACDLYGGPKRVLFVVIEDEKNLFDQTFLEVELWRNW